MRKHLARNFNPEHNILEYFDMLHFFLSAQVKRSVIITNKNGLGLLGLLTLQHTNWKQRSQLSITCMGQPQNGIPRKEVNLRKISKIHWNHSPLPTLPPEIHIYLILLWNYWKPLLNFSYPTWICSWTMTYSKQSNRISSEKRMFSNRFFKATYSLF